MSNGNGGQQELKDGQVMFALGEVNGQVVITFPKPVTYVKFDPENARELSEQLARSAYRAHYNIAPPAPGKSLVAEGIRRKLHARARLIIRSMMEQHKHPDYIANQVVDQLLKEIDS